MRPDRIIVGEVRGAEALDMLQAMNTGHEGSMTTVHANSARDALSRLETMVLMAGFDLPVRAIREQIASAIDLIMQVDRMPDGRRVVTAVTEVQGLEGDTILLQDIFKYRYAPGRRARQADRRAGAPPACGPKFLDKLTEQRHRGAGHGLPGAAGAAAGRPPPPTPRPQGPGPRRRASSPTASVLR